MNTDIQKAISPLKEKLINHPVYQLIQDKEDVQKFMELHVFAVWDFMSLLKALQQKLTSTQIPWKPVANADVARFINEIVLGEETDVDQEGKVKSHYELYIDAMHSVGANSSIIQKMVNELSDLEEVLNFLQTNKELPTGVKRFLSFSFRLIQEGEPHKIASAFTFGREDLIPDIFTSVLKEIGKEDNSIAPLLYYLNRHIELDGDEHGPLSIKMIAVLCGDDQQKWQEAEEVAIEALKMRLTLWDEIYACLVDSVLS